MRALLLAALLFASGAEARTVKKTVRDARTLGLGRSCKKTADCKHPGQRCIVRADAKGKQLSQGMCVLPCASYEAGTTKVTPGAEGDAAAKKKDPPPRCPKTYQCRSAGAGVPIDICVKE